MTVKKILFIQHESPSSSKLPVLLERCGYMVEKSHPGAMAIPKNRDEQDAWGLIFLDLNDSAGADAKTLAMIQQTYPDMPIITLTRQGTIDGAVDAIKNGAVDYLTTPVAEHALKTIIERYYRPNQRCADQAAVARHSAKTKTLITADPGFQKLLDLARRVAPGDANILIHGESGSGKELLACYIHRHSRRAEKPYIALNCAALPENLAESELFGYEKGAFTGAGAKKAGKFELADGGTLLLDEISEMALPLQAKLLRSLQEREIDRIGGSKPIPVDVRVIAVSNVDLKEKITEGKFREDLFFRLNVIPLKIPPLRERKSDIPLLASHFLTIHTQSSPGNQLQLQFARETMELLINKKWKGNVRELENIIQRATMICDGPLILPEHLLLSDAPTREADEYAVRAGVSVREMEKKLIQATLHQVGHNRTLAAEMLGISIRTLRNKLNEYRLENENLTQENL